LLAASYDAVYLKKRGFKMRWMTGCCCVGKTRWMLHATSEDAVQLKKPGFNMTWIT